MCHVNHRMYALLNKTKQNKTIHQPTDGHSQLRKGASSHQKRIYDERQDGLL